MSTRPNNPVFFKTVFNSTPVGLAVIDERGIFIEVNEKLCSKFGYNTTELNNLPAIIIFPKSIQQDVIEIQASVLQNGESTQQTSWQGKTKQGLLIDLAVSFDRFVDEKGDRFIVASFRDVSDETRKRIVTESTHLQYRSIIDNSMHAFFLTRPDGTILDANKAAENMFGYSVEELCKIGRTSIIDDADPRVNQKLTERAQKGFAAGEITGIRKGGEKFPLEFSSIIFKGINGEENTSTFIYDISVRKEQKQKIRQSQEEMASILNNTEEMFMVIDKQYRVVNYNKATKERAKSILGKELKLGDSLLSLAEPERYAYVTAIYNKVLAGEKIRYKHIVDRGLGTENYQLTYSPVFDADGSCNSFMVTVRDITVEEKVLAEITHSQQLLQQAESIAHVGSWEFDLVANKLYWSDEVFRICGYEPNAFEVTFENGLAVIHPEDQASSIREMQNAISAKGSYAMDKRFVRPDGSIRYIKSKAKVILDNDGKAVRLIGVFHDVTDQRAMEHELAVSQQEYKSLFNQNPDAVVSFDLTGNFISVNDAGLSLAETTREKVLNEKYDSYFNDGEAEIIRSHFKEAKIGNAQRFQTTITTVTGKKKALAVSMMPIIIDSEITGVFGILKDVTTEKLYEDELKFQSHLLNTIQQSVIVTKPDGTIIYWNRFAEKLYGWKNEETIGVNIKEVISLDLSIDSDKEIMMRLAQGESWSGEFLVKHKENGPFTAQIHNSPLLDAQNKLIGIIGVSWDISERKLAEQQKEFERLDKEALINSTTDLVWSVSKDYKLIAANKAFNQSLEDNYNIRLSPGDNVLTEDVFTAELAGFWKNVYSRALKGEAFTIELHIPQRNNNDNRWEEITFNPIFINEEVIGVACRGRDITENKVYQQKLLAVNDQLETAQQIAKLGYWSYDLENDVLFWSNEVYTIFGLENDAFNSDFNSFFQQVHPDDREAFLKVQKLILAGNIPLEHEHRIVLPNGDVKYVIQKGTVMFNDDGEPVHLEGTIQDITDVKNAALALKVNEEQLNLIYNSTAGIIFLLGVENNGEAFRFISMNNAGLGAIGVTEEQLFNKPVHEIIPEPSLSLVLSKYKEAVQSGKQVIWQEETTYPTGTKIGIVTVTPIYDSRGVCIQLVGSVNDITELKQIEKSLAISRQEYKSLFDHNPDAVYSLDLQGRFTSFNPGLEKLLECGREELIQAVTFLPFCHPDDLDKTMRHFLKVQQGTPQTYDVRAITFRGNQKYLSIANIPIVVDGEITGVYGIAKDVTSEQLALAQLELSNERYEYATKATNDVIWDWDLQTNKVIRAGSGFLIMFGYNEKEANSDDSFWIKKVHPDDTTQLLQKRSQVLSDPKQDFWEDEYRFLRSNGEYAFVYDRGYIFRNADGEPVRMIGATKDITAQKISELQLKDLYDKLEERASQLQLSNTELERFAYIASHDLQEPLRMVSSFLQLLGKKYQGAIDEKGREYIRFAVDGSLRMKRLINDLLDYSRVTTRKQELESVNMDLLIHDVLQNLSLQITEKDAIIKRGVLPLLPAADKTQMVQLLQNLVANALKYSGNIQPVIEIEATEQEDEWLFSVKDNGIGFDEKFADKIFVIFQRLHNKSEYSGTGMGLAICKKIVDRHGGKIYAESVQGKGSTFWFTIKKQLIQGSNFI